MLLRRGVMDLSEYVSKKQEAAIGNSLRKNAGGGKMRYQKNFKVRIIF